ncbi:MAG: hypothetical protein J3K34DRAFT_525820 [Monoraphidium minutum]|nr:MAG: hypothetical protein J3K34DRAFT_525820 [Monoraphidium minutum]
MAPQLWGAAVAASLLLLLPCRRAAAARAEPVAQVTGDVAAFEAAVTASATSGPTGTVTIAGGANATCAKKVNITVTATPGSGAAYACLRMESSSSGWWGWGSCRVGVVLCPLELDNSTGIPTRTVTFYPCSRQNIVRAEAVFKTSGGATGPPVFAETLVDCWPPSMAGVSIRVAATAAAAPAPAVAPGNASVSLYWKGAGARDSGAGVAGYRLAYRAAPDGGAPKGGCRAGPGVAVLPAPEDATLSNPLVVSGLAPGTKFRFRLCAFDAAGNVANGVTRAATTPAA